MGTNSRFNQPVGVSISPWPDGLFALVAEFGNHFICQIILSTAAPSSLPSASPTIPSTTVFGFGVKIGDEEILNSGKAILVDYVKDKGRGLSYLILSACFILLLLLPF
jgi:hypothetical protein